MLEGFLQKLFERSAAMQALRKAAKKATIQGIAEGLGCELGGPEELPLEIVDERPSGTSSGASEPKTQSGMPLPKPKLLGIAGKGAKREEDRPGVPPKSVRKPRGPQAPQAPEPEDGEKEQST